jgi:hypothetical protein
MGGGTGMGRNITHAVRLALFQAHQEEDVLLLTPCPWECNQQGEEVSNYLDQDVAMIEKQALRGNENYRLLGKRMGLASRKPQ